METEFKPEEVAKPEADSAFHSSLPHQLKFLWKPQGFRPVEQLRAPEGFALENPLADSPNLYFAPLLYHATPLAWLQPLLQTLDIQAAYANIATVVGQHQLPPSWFSPDFGTNVIISFFLLQEILGSPFWPEVDASVTPDAATPRVALGGPTTDHLRFLHRTFQNLPRVQKVPLDRCRCFDVVEFCAAIFESLACFFVRASTSSGSNLAEGFGSPWAILTEEFIGTFGAELVSSVREELLSRQFLYPITFAISVPDGAKQPHERVQKLRESCDILGFTEAEPETAPMVTVTLQDFDYDMDFNAPSYYNHSIQKRLVDGQLRTRVPIATVKPTLLDGQHYSLMRPLDGGLTFVWEKMVYHAVGCPPSWDHYRDHSLDYYVRQVPASVLPESIWNTYWQDTGGLHLSESFLLASAEVNEILNPADFAPELEALRPWAHALPPNPEVSLHSDIPVELQGFLPEVAADLGEVGPVSCWLDVAVGPTIAAPAHATIQKFSKEIEGLCRHPKVATLVGKYAIPKLRDAVGTSSKAQEIAQHLAQWFVYSLQHPSEFELVATAADPTAQHALFSKQAALTGVHCGTAGIHPTALAQWRGNYLSVRHCLEGLLKKVAGPQALEVLHQNRVAQQQQQLLQQQQSPPPPSTQKISADYFSRMDAENRMMSLATLYLDVPRRVADPAAPDYSILSAPTLPEGHRASERELTLPVTFPAGIIPVQPRQLGDLKGLWGDGDCYGCPEAMGPLINLIDPVGSNQSVSVQRLLEGQRQILNASEPERPDLCTLMAAEWYKPGIISDVDFREMGSLLGQKPQGKKAEAAKQFVAAYMAKHGADPDTAERELWQTLGKVNPKWKDYILVRDGIVRFYRADPSRYLTVSDCRHQIWGNAVSVMRVYAFLEFYGLINLQATQVPGGLKGAQFRPLAKGLVYYKGSQRGSSKRDNFMGTFCNSCHKLQLRRVMRTVREAGRSWCPKCLAEGNIPRAYALEDFSPVLLNPIKGSSLDTIQIAVEGWKLEELELMTQACIERQSGSANRSILSDSEFWTNVSLQLKEKLHDATTEGNDKDMTTTEETSVFDAKLANLMNGHGWDAEAAARRDPVYALIAYLAISRIKYE